jgi:hypothetical protein
MVPFYQSGNGNLKVYKSTVQKCHKVYIEKKIGVKSKSEFLIALRKLNQVLYDVAFVKKYYQEIKYLSKMAKQ